LDYSTQDITFPAANYGNICDPNLQDIFNAWTWWQMKHGNTWRERDWLVRSKWLTRNALSDLLDYSILLWP